ncbi:protein-(glutamine-N5) methyltransferase, release factor-specific [Virgibacillus phasianinus]|uniref:Release factor glutamine methyltransferase n=1 Tax=Virgibacillus phasianinus TaxID=2017483 RepID=A0A220U1V5_9BACI|nr:peptide chain release factor N(5)-glutamine methyltransferase [Virgibacillus phasianinus]ASK62070.1 protein-(glutamine-N5) methyltransferase, release factor-specific [Virgibacillus phasianinus]
MEMKQYEVLQWASLFLEKHHRETHVGELLLLHYLGTSRSAFFANMREPVPSEIVNTFKQSITLHAETGMPIQHITGAESFYGREFIVNKDVLIPRPETEELIEHILQNAKDEPQTIADIGTGSGIIAITLALELPLAKVYATDLSKSALDIAKQNAKRLGANVTFMQGDFVQPVVDKGINPDILVSNPPYIAPADESLLSDTVRKFDPHLALFADENGLAAYKQIIHSMPPSVKKTVFEIGHEQGRAVSQLIKNKYPKADVAVIKDINGHDRIISANM